MPLKYERYDVLNGVDKISKVDKDVYRMVLKQKTIYTNKGYTLRYFPEHPRSNSRGYVFTHILVVEYNIGRFLYYDENNFNQCEVPHHKNLNGLDNRYENLQLMTQEEHNMLHKKLLAIRRGAPYYYDYDWLYQKYIVDRHTIIELAKMCNVHRNNMSIHLRKMGLR